MFPLQFIEKNRPTHSFSKEERLEQHLRVVMVGPPGCSET